jgi:amino acid transporter
VPPGVRHHDAGTLQLKAPGIVMTGRVAAQDAGPAIVVSYVVAGIGCALAAFCYAEFASMAPVAGSAYTYAYATLGELLAWIIGWDLILEYAVASMTVAHGWSKNFQDVLAVMGFHVPHAVSASPFDYDPALGHFVSTGSLFDLPGILIAALVTWVLVVGIRESAGFNTVMVVIASSTTTPESLASRTRAFLPRFPAPRIGRFPHCPRDSERPGDGRVSK